MKKALFVIAMILGIVLNTWSQNNQTMPDMVLKDANGKSRNMNEYSKNGKITIISFWATWCTPCKKELNNINELLEDWKLKYDLELVAVSTDNARNVMKVKPYVDGQAWEFDVILDVNQDLQRALNIVQIPHTFLLDRSGKIIYSHTGYVEGDEYMLEEKIKAALAKK